MKKAYFVRHPRVLERLKRPHLLSEELGYTVVKTVTLAAIDYENFVTDMAADRQFIEDYAHLCEEGEPMRCIFVKRKDKDDGVLVVPENGCFVRWAAYVWG